MFILYIDWFILYRLKDLECNYKRAECRVSIVSPAARHFAIRSDDDKGKRWKTHWIRKMTRVPCPAEWRQISLGRLALV